MIVSELTECILFSNIDIELSIRSEINSVNLVFLEWKRIELETCAQC